MGLLHFCGHQWGISENATFVLDSLCEVAALVLHVNHHPSHSIGGKVPSADARVNIPASAPSDSWSDPPVAKYRSIRDLVRRLVSSSESVPDRKLEGVEILADLRGDVDYTIWDFFAALVLVALLAMYDVFGLCRRSRAWGAHYKAARHSAPTIRYTALQ